MLLSREVFDYILFIVCINENSKHFDGLFQFLSLFLFHCRPLSLSSTHLKIVKFYGVFCFFFFRRNYCNFCFFFESSYLWNYGCHSLWIELVPSHFCSSTFRSSYSFVIFSRCLLCFYLSIFVWNLRILRQQSILSIIQCTMSHNNVISDK